MTIYLNAASVQSVLPTPVAPLIEGSAAPTLNSTANFNGVASAFFDFGSSLTGRYGMRINLATPWNVEASKFITFAVGHGQFSPGAPLDTVANGGRRIIFVDGAGIYAGFNTYGSLPTYNASGAPDGFLVSFGTNNIIFSIALSRTPDISNGSINWGNIVAIEVTAKTPSASRKDCHISRIVKRSIPYLTGTETLKSLNDAAYAAKDSTSGDLMLLRSAPLYLGAAAQTNFNIRLGLQIGNGATTTNFTDSNFAIGFENLYEYSPGAPSYGPWVQLDDLKTRPFAIVQSASDVLNLSDGSLSSAGGWQWELSGIGVATCTRVQFWRFNGFRAAHGDYIDCAWNDADTPAEVTAATVISGGLIRGAKSTALKITGAAGVYSGLELEIDGLAATYDVELGEGGAGTYELPHITVPAGRTLRVRNNSAVNAVVVKLPLGLAYTTSTAGGAITVEIPEVSVAVVASALISGSRVQLYNVTDGVEMFNSVLPSSGLAHTVLYTGNKIVRLRADHASKLPLETAGVLTPSGLTFLDVQAEDDVYLANSVDGSTVTEFAPDGPNLQVDINDPDGTTKVQRLYAWMQWYMTTEEGIASPFFGSIYAVDEFNYIVDQSKVNLKLDNISPIPLLLIGARIARKDGSALIAASSGSIQIEPGFSYSNETGVSGLTADESTKLNQISLLALETTAQAIKNGVVQSNVVQVAGASIAGSGTEQDPWGPAA